MIILSIKVIQITILVLMPQISKYSTQVEHAVLLLIIHMLKLTTKSVHQSLKIAPIQIIAGTQILTLLIDSQHQLAVLILVQWMQRIRILILTVLGSFLISLLTTMGVHMPLTQLLMPISQYTMTIMIMTIMVILLASLLCIRLNLIPKHQMLQRLPMPQQVQD